MGPSPLNVSFGENKYWETTSLSRLFHLKTLSDSLRRFDRISDVLGYRRDERAFHDEQRLGPTVR